MNVPELFISLLAVMCIVALLAQKIHLSYPVAFLLGGIAIGVEPHLPSPQIPPSYILLLFLPPLLMEAAFFTSLRDFKFSLRPILQLSLGLVVVTSVAVAFVFERLIPGGGWILGVVLGAIISPPDAVAASAIIRKLNVPKRIVTVLEGESLLNDAGGLIIYQVAVGAVVWGGFSAVAAAASFAWMVIGGIAIGTAISLVFVKIFPKIKEPSVEIISSFLVPYIAYLIADITHASGVLAVVVAGLVVGWHAPTLFQPRQRIPMEAIWKMVTFFLNGVVFLLIGLSFPEVMKDLASYSLSSLLIYAVAICGVTVLTRLIYVFAIAYGTRFIFPGVRKTDPYPPWQNVFVIAWTGMRGVVSLATALALPLTIVSGAAFPYRSLVIFLAFSVIVFTLVFQGLTLPWILKLLPLKFNPDIIWEDWRARVAAARQALEHIEKIELEDPIHRPAWERVRSYYKDRLKSLGDGPNTPLFPSEQPTSHNHPLVQAENCLWQQVIDVERNTVVELRQKFEIGDDIMHDILRELDLLHSRFSAPA